MHPKAIGLLAGAVFVVVATLIGFTMIVDSQSPTGVQNETGVAAIGGPFTLTDKNGKRVTQADLLGKPTAIFFGFTRCPDVCPTTLYELSGLIEEIGAEADKLNFVFVSVNWERDGPEELASYTSAFDDRIRGLSGTKDEIEAITKAYKVYYAKVPTPDGGYTIDHTASVYLMDQNGRFAGTLSQGEAHEAMLAKLQRLARDA